MNSWSACKNILCIRADNMGDLLMSSVAIRALKESFNPKITVLTSAAATSIASLIPEIDEVITFDFPWVKTEELTSPEILFDIVKELKIRHFDAAVIFSVYSQSAIPAAMLAWLCEIPLRLAYCRENPYRLLTHWLPDKEPYSIIKHQVRRDLDLVASIGAVTKSDQLLLQIPDAATESTKNKLKKAGVNTHRQWLILHPGVSEAKREYPFVLWTELAAKLIKQTNCQILFTGGKSEKELTDRLQQATGPGSFSLGGCFSLEEFTAFISLSPMVISVNTSTVHIAAATKTPVIVLYALTNPQHVPWKANGYLFPFEVPSSLRSKNEIIRFVNERFFSKPVDMVLPEEIVKAAQNILNGEIPVIHEMLFMDHHSIDEKKLYPPIV